MRADDLHKKLLVPNAPCGVERKISTDSFLYCPFGVPNAPCGVESLFKISFLISTPAVCS